MQTIEVIKPLAPIISQTSTVFAIPLDAPNRKFSKRVYEPMALMLIEEEKEKKHLFQVYDDLRLKEIYNMGNEKPLKHRTISDAVNYELKDQAFQKI